MNEFPTCLAHLNVGEQRVRAALPTFDRNIVDIDGLIGLGIALPWVVESVLLTANHDCLCTDMLSHGTHSRDSRAQSLAAKPAAVSCCSFLYSSITEYWPKSSLT